MDNRAKPIAALSGFAAAAVVVAAFATGVGETRSVAETGLNQGSVFAMCSGPADSYEPSFYSEMAKLSVDMHNAMDVAPSGDIDRDFARMMIPHHQGAIDMALVLLKYGRDQKLKRLAQSILVEQGQEIAYMRSLLEAPRNHTSANPTTK
jgi:uncharacterized protein (DUF305 family)